MVTFVEYLLNISLKLSFMTRNSFLFCSLAALSLCSLSFAQSRQTRKANPENMAAVVSNTRTEIILPDVDGYKALKTDLHNHTVYSDGDCSPEYRVWEAWRDGLDAVAITDHIEYRPGDKKMAAYLGVKTPETTDLNHSVNLAKAKAEGYGITIIPGIEITRSAQEVGHFNALFTVDNNRIPDPDPYVAIQNAKAQDAVVQNNHPGWARTDAEFTQTTNKAIASGMISGVEVINDVELYQRTIEDAVKNNLYICAGTDIHSTTYDIYLRNGWYRNMTIVFAKDSSLESIKEALLAKRTLAYGFGDICGTREMLEKFFLASFDYKTISVDNNGTRRVMLTNKTSFQYIVDYEGASVDMKFEPFSSNILTVKAGSDLVLTVKNMWCGIEKHPAVTIK